MPKDLYSIMLNPTRMRIVQAFASQQTMTTNALCEIICDVPRTTLYRQINLLIEAKVLTVVEETKVRGAVERRLSLNVDQLNTQNTLDNIPQKAFSFLMNTYAKFEKYFNRKDFTPGGNTVFLNNTVLMMDDGEFDSFLSELQALLVKYNFTVKDGRRPRDLSIISAPPLLNEDDEQE
jgi:hypothetical protein